VTWGYNNDNFNYYDIYRLKYKNIKFKVSLMAIQITSVQMSGVLLYNTQRNILATWERLLLP